MTKPNYIALDVDALRSKLEALNAKYGEAFAEDEALHHDVLEGSTDLHEVLSRILDHKQEADAMVAAVSERENNLSIRRKRWADKSEAMRDLAFDLMKSSNLPSLTLPHGTLSIAKGHQFVLITNVADIPQGFVVMEPKIDKAGIGKALKAGEDIPGATLQTGPETLVIRSK